MHGSKVLFSLFLVSILVGCGTITTNKYMHVSTNAAHLKPEPGKALIIFRRESSAIRRMYSSNLWNLTDKSAPDIIGHMDSGMKVAYQAPAGDYVFVITHAAAAFMMKAKLSEGKTYFVDMEMYATKGLIFNPVRVGEDNPITMENITLPSKELKEWAKRLENVNSALNTLNKAKLNWNKLSEDEKRQLTMLPEDGK